jgi:hypothetical protein
MTRPQAGDQYVTWKDCMFVQKGAMPISDVKDPWERAFYHVIKAVAYMPGFVADTFLLPCLLLLDGYMALIYHRWDFRLTKRCFCFYPWWFGRIRVHHDPSRRYGWSAGEER